MGFQAVQDPQAVKQHTFDWSSWLGTGETITTATVVADTGLTVSAVTHDTTTVTFKLSGSRVLTSVTTVVDAKTYTAAAGTFTQDDVGLRVSGTGVGPDSEIASVNLDGSIATGTVDSTTSATITNFIITDVTLGTRYKVVCRVTTSAGQKDDDTLHVRILDA